MKTLIVDDSRLARKELAELLQEIPGMLLIAEAADVASALAAINTRKPDLILLDIHLPDGNGFDLLEKADFTPQVIFTTAYEQHALRAFEVNALDYLLKPITAQRLKQALERLTQPTAAINTAIAKHYKTREDQLFIRDGERCHFVRLSELRLVSVEGNYLRLHFRDTTALLPRSLNYVEERFDPDLFFRANRQQLINMDYVARIEPWIHEGLLLIMKDGAEVEVSRRQAKELKLRLDI